MNNSVAPGKVVPDRYCQFLELHEAQLKSLGVPTNLYEPLFMKLVSQCFDGFEHFGIEQDEDNNRQCKFFYDSECCQHLTIPASCVLFLYYCLIFRSNHK